MTRGTFDGQLQQFEEDLLSMASLADGAIAFAVRALVDRNTELARDVIAGDVHVNQAQRQLEEQGLVLIATQQPMAGDLRTILAVSNIASELERIADHAKGIAEITLLTADRPPIKPLIDIPRMADRVRWMLNQELSAFTKRDVELARTAARADDEVDALYDQILRELLVIMMENPSTIGRATYLLWVAHNLERVGDRATNIGERVIYLVDAEIVELDP